MADLGDRNEGLSKRRGNSRHGRAHFSSDLDLRQSTAAVKAAVVPRSKLLLRLLRWLRRRGGRRRTIRHAAEGAVRAGHAQRPGEVALREAWEGLLRADRVSGQVDDAV